MPPNNLNLTLEQIQDLISQENEKFLSIVGALQSGILPSEISNSTPSTTTSSRNTVECVEGVEDETQIIELQPLQMNQIGFNVIPDNLSVESIFGESDILVMVNDSGQYYAPTFGINQIGSIDVTDGYQLFLQGTTPQTISVTGCPIDIESAGITLEHLMVNFLPYNGNVEIPATEFFANYTNDILMVSSDSGGYFAPQYGIDTTLVPGNMYQTFTSVQSGPEVTVPISFTAPQASIDTSLFTPIPEPEPDIIEVPIRDFFQCYLDGGYILGACDYTGVLIYPNEGTISTYDLQFMGEIIESIPGLPRYKPECDINGDETVNPQDVQKLSIFLTEYNETGQIPIIPGEGIHERYNIGDCVQYLDVAPPQPMQCPVPCYIFECDYCLESQQRPEFIPCCNQCCSDVVYGCTYPAALNYDMRATEDDGTCTFDVDEEDDGADEVIMFGCVDPSACNYNPNADESSDPIIYCDYGRSCPDGSRICPEAGEVCPPPDQEQLPELDLAEQIAINNINISDKTLSLGFEVIDIDNFDDRNPTININWGTGQLSESFTMITDFTEVLTSEYTYSNYGNYTITVELYNDGTLNDTVSFDVNIAEFLPELEDFIQVNALRIFENRTVELDFTYIDYNYQPLEENLNRPITVSWGDSSNLISTTVPVNTLLTFPHEYGDWGTYTVALTTENGERTEIVIPLTEDAVEFEGDWIEGGEWNYIANTLPPSSDILLCDTTQFDGTSADADCVGQVDGSECAFEYGYAYGRCRAYPTARTLKVSMYETCASQQILDSTTIEQYLTNAKLRTYQYSQDGSVYQSGTDTYSFGSFSGMVYLESGKGYIFKPQENNSFCLKLNQAEPEL